MLFRSPWPPQVRETQNDRWQDVREGGEAGEVFDRGALGLRTGRRGEPLLLPYAPSDVGGPKSK